MFIDVLCNSENEAEILIELDFRLLIYNNQFWWDYVEI